MRDFLTVLRYTFRENIRKTTFIVTTLIILVLTVALMILPALFTNSPKTPEPGENPSSQTITKNFYVIDKIQVLNGDVAFLQKAFPDSTVELKKTTDADALIARIKNEDNTFLLVLDERDGSPMFDYYVKKYGVGPDPSVLGPLVKSAYTTSILSSAGVDTTVTQKVLATPEITVNELGKGYLKSMISSMIIIFILFFAIYFFGYGIAMSIASEKTSRVMETLVTSTKPSRIIIGKTIAMGLLGLMQLSLILFTAIIFYRLFFPKNFKIFGESIDFSAFTPLAIAMTVIYFIFGYLLYATLNAVAGASVSKAEDVNTAIMPVSMISLIAFYAAYFPSTFPTSGNINTITSMIPFTSPFSMPSRLVMGNVPALELVISLFLLIATTALFSWISIKIYSSAILHYGNKLKLSDFVRMTKNK